VRTRKGENEDQKESAVFLTRTFGVALALMAIILLTQFNSFYSCLLILSAVILSTIGVTVGLIVTGQPFSVVMTGVGIIALAGTVVQNNIVLIDTYDQYRKQGASEVDAIVRTGADRLRPVLLTALNTVLGLDSAQPGPEHRPAEPRGDLQRPGDAVVDPDRHGHCLRSGFRHRSDPGGHAQRADDAGQCPALAGGAAAAPRRSLTAERNCQSFLPDMAEQGRSAAPDRIIARRQVQPKSWTA
jgi:hypothetical protein